MWGLHDANSQCWWSIPRILCHPRNCTCLSVKKIPSFQLHFVLRSSDLTSRGVIRKCCCNIVLNFCGAIISKVNPLPLQILQISVCRCQIINYTAIFLINGLCLVYCSLLQCLTLVYLGWGQKSEFFCLLVSTRRLQSGTVVGNRSTTTAYCRCMGSQGPLKYPRVRDNRRYLVTVCL